MAEDIEEVDDSERNKSDPGKTQEEKEPNFGCSEIKVADESESNKAGRSRSAVISVPKTCYMHIDLTPTNTSKAIEKKLNFVTATSNRASAVEYIRYEVDELRSQVTILRSQIDNIRSQIDGRSSGSRSPSSLPRHVALAHTIAQLTGPTRFESPPEEPVLRRSASTPRPNRRNRREPRRFSPTLAIVPEDEDMLEEEQEQAPKRPVGDFLISDSRPGSSSSKGKSVVIDSSSQQCRGGCAGPRRMDDDISLELADKIAADQLMLYEDIDHLLSQVSNLTDQALQLKTQADGGPQSCNPESKAPTTQDKEDELKLSRAVRRLEITNKTDLASLDSRNIELAHKAAHLRSQVKDLQSLVNDLRSKLRSPNNRGDRTRDDGPRYQYSEQCGRSSPARERTETESSSSSASQERHGKSI